MLQLLRIRATENCNATTANHAELFGSPVYQHIGDCGGISKQRKLPPCDLYAFGEHH